MSTESFFPETYQAGRDRFLELVADRGLAVDRFDHPMTGLEGEALTTDVVRIGPGSARKVLVTSCSTHGVEGMLGSGVQNSSMLLGNYDDLPAGVAVLLIHAINPWGFSWLRRANEDGVDLFRNFINFDQPVPENPLFDALVDKIVPRSLGFGASIKSTLSMAFLSAKFGMKRLKAEIPTGQYRHEHAPFFGGFAPTWSNRTLRTILRRHLSAATHVIAIDYHTGLGKYGSGELLGFDRPGEQGHEDAKACWGEDYVSVYSADTTAYEIHGILFNAYKEELPKARMHFASHEFGTLNEKKVFRALQADHWLYAYGDARHPTARRIRRNLKRAFYCDEDRWKRMVLDRAVKAEMDALRFLARSA